MSDNDKEIQRLLKTGVRFVTERIKTLSSRGPTRRQGQEWIRQANEALAKAAAERLEGKGE